jgi:hypothetical protein
MSVPVIEVVDLIMPNVSELAAIYIKVSGALENGHSEQESMAVVDSRVLSIPYP